MINTNNSTCNNEGLADNVREQILLARGATGSLSVFFCILSLVLLIMFRIRRYVRELRIIDRLQIYFVSFSMATSIVSVLQLSADDKHQWCSTVGFFNQWTSWMVLLSMQMILLHILVDTHYPFSDGPRCYRRLTEVLYVLIPILFPLLYSWIPFIHDAYGQAGVWCWIRKEDQHCNEFLEGLIEQYALWYAPLFLIETVDLLSTIFLYPFFVIKKIHIKENRISLLKQHAPLLALITISVLVNLVGVINRIYRIIHSNENIHLWMIHAIVPASWGILASIGFIAYLIIRCSLRGFKIEATQKK